MPILTLAGFLGQNTKHDPLMLPDGTGVEVCRDIRAALPDVRCLMLTSYADDEALFDAIMAGASGYVLKEIRGNDLIDAIRQVASGKSLLDPAATARVLERLRAGEPESQFFERTVHLPVAPLRNTPWQPAQRSK